MTHLVAQHVRCVVGFHSVERMAEPPPLTTVEDAWIRER